MAQDLDPTPRSSTRIERLATDVRVPVRRVSRSRARRRRPHRRPPGRHRPRRPLPEAELDDLCQPDRPAAPPFLVAVDGVTDPGNLGALLRSGRVRRAPPASVLPRHRAVHVTPTVAKAAAGAVEHLPMAVVGRLPAALDRVKELGCWVVGLEGDGDGSLFDDLAVADEAIVVVVGAEGGGLSRLVRARCDLVVRIPMRGRLGSLNVSTAGALALFEVSRRR